MAPLPTPFRLVASLALAALTFASVAPASAQRPFQIEVEGEGLVDPHAAETEEAEADEAPPATAEEPVAEAPVTDGEDAQARALFQAGTTYYERGEYAEAYGQFVRAYEISRRPVLMYNASQAAERAGDLEHAIEWLQRFVDSPDAEAAERDRQRPRLANLQARFRREGGARGPGDGDADDGFFMPVPAFIAYLVGGAGLLTFATFGILTLHEDGSLSDTCNTRACTSSDLSSLHTFARATDAGWIIGVAGVATGTVLWLTLHGDSSEDDEVAFEPWLSPRLVGASARLRF